MIREKQAERAGQVPGAGMAGGWGAEAPPGCTAAGRPHTGRCLASQEMTGQCLLNSEEKSFSTQISVTTPMIN